MTTASCLFPHLIDFHGSSRSLIFPTSQSPYYLTKILPSVLYNFLRQGSKIVLIRHKVRSLMKALEKSCINPLPIHRPMKLELVAVLVFKVDMILSQTDNLSEGSGPLDVCSFTSCVQGGVSITATSAPSVVTWTVPPCSVYSCDGAWLKPTCSGILFIFLDP